jgi:hypothetical protein
MPTPTFEIIKSTTTTTTQTNVEFTSIPNTYTDLQLWVAGSINGGGFFQIQYNGDTTNGNYVQQRLLVYSGGKLADFASQVSNDATIGTSSSSPGQAIFDIQSYKNTNIWKPIILRNSNWSTNGSVNLQTCTWVNTAAINSLKIFVTGTDYFNTGLTVTLYGIKAG